MFYNKCLRDEDIEMVMIMKLLVPIGYQIFQLIKS